MRILVAVTLLGLAASAHADPDKTPDVRAMHADDCARARAQHKTCVLDMGKDDDLTATAPTAGGSAISLISFGKAASLIHIRRDFITEILRSAEDL